MDIWSSKTTVLTVLGATATLCMFKSFVHVKNPTPDLVCSELEYISLSLIDSTQGKHFRLICDSKLYCGRCIQFINGLETKSGVCGCCNVLNQRWLIVFRISLFYNLAMKLFLGLSSRGASRHCACII